jgi:hypothetical protein
MVAASFQEMPFSSAKAFQSSRLLGGPSDPHPSAKAAREPTVSARVRRSNNTPPGNPNLFIVPIFPPFRLSKTNLPLLEKEREIKGVRFLDSLLNNPSFSAVFKDKPI